MKDRQLLFAAIGIIGVCLIGSGCSGPPWRNQAATSDVYNQYLEEAVVDARNSAGSAMEASGSDVGADVQPATESPPPVRISNSSTYSGCADGCKH